MNPWLVYIAWLQAVCAAPKSRTDRTAEYLVRELEEDIEMLEEHGDMSLWRES